MRNQFQRHDAVWPVWIANNVVRVGTAGLFLQRCPGAEHRMVSGG